MLGVHKSLQRRNKNGWFECQGYLPPLNSIVRLLKLLVMAALESYLWVLKSSCNCADE
jgi:hypothetical protein